MFKIADEEAEEPIDMSFPKGGDWKKILIYLISFPIMFPLYYTLPDTKKPKCKYRKVVSRSMSWLVRGHRDLLDGRLRAMCKIFGKFLQ